MAGKSVWEIKQKPDIAMVTAGLRQLWRKKLKQQSTQ
jgi:hypothetical protein